MPQSFDYAILIRTISTVSANDDSFEEQSISTEFRIPVSDIDREKKNGDSVFLGNFEGISKFFNVNLWIQ